MIDIGKLLPQADNSLITERSVKKLGIVERKLNLIDSLLKEKLVLSKVRQGIEREEQQRITRTQTEIDLEKDDDNDMDDGQKGKRKKKDPKNQSLRPRARPKNATSLRPKVRPS
mgnify:CR=1 FL=1